MIARQIVMALRSKNEAEIECARANVQVYLAHPAGVAEHPDIIASVDSQMAVIAEARDNLQEIPDMEMAQLG